jgi:hypothetical protein
MTWKPFPFGESGYHPEPPEGARTLRLPRSSELSGGQNPNNVRSAIATLIWENFAAYAYGGCRGHVLEDRGAPRVPRRIPVTRAGAYPRKIPNAPRRSAGGGSGRDGIVGNFKGDIAETFVVTSNWTGSARRSAGLLEKRRRFPTIRRPEARLRSLRSIGDRRTGLPCFDNFLTARCRLRTRFDYFPRNPYA